MPVVKYECGDVDLLKRLAGKLPPLHGLRYPEFVDHYYASSPWCDLWVSVGKNGDVFGALGVERMNFAVESREVVLGLGSNFISFQPGAGGGLLRQWLTTCDFGLTFGGTEEAQRFYRGRNWTYYPDVRTFFVNRAYRSQPDESWWKKLARVVLRHVRPKVAIARRARRILRDGSPPVEVIEERIFTEDMLPKQTPFAFRFCPGVDFLNWRYATELPFVRYRLFRIVSAGDSPGAVTVGYVIINELPDRLLVAQCDGDDPLLLVRGIYAALEVVAEAEPRRREVLLTCSHTVMQESLRRFGFRASRHQRPFGIGGLRGNLDLPADVGQWLINFDWGDNGLRAPFLGRPSL